jgi:hypothetical protein
MAATGSPLAAAAIVGSGANRQSEGMKKALAVLALLVGTQVASADELNVNAFRNPSIGLEYRRGFLAAHAGLYPTILSKDQMGSYETSWFTRAGVTAFFLPKSWYGQRPSEFYVSASYLRGLNLDHGNAALVDVGYRWMGWRGLNVRLGVAMFLEREHDVKINPTPGVGWSTAW